MKSKMGLSGYSLNPLEYWCLFHVTGICLSVQSAALTLKVAPFAFLATESWDVFKV